MNNIVLSIDIDWAPDFMIEDTINILSKCGTKATWFVTHKTDMLEEIRKNKNFELGLHPNFLKDFKNGEDYSKTIENLLSFVPDAKGIRTHALFYHHYLLEVYVKYGLKYDSSIYLKEISGILPFVVSVGNKKIVKIPFFWSEECNLKQNVSFDNIGLKVLCLHPVHIFLNSCNPENYTRLKNDVDISSCSEKDAKKYINNINFGTRNFIESILENNICNKTLEEISDCFFR